MHPQPQFENSYSTPHPQYGISRVIDLRTSVYYFYCMFISVVNIVLYFLAVAIYVFVTASYPARQSDRGKKIAYQIYDT